MSVPTLTLRLSPSEHATLKSSAARRKMSVARYLLALARADRQADGDRTRRRELLDGEERPTRTAAFPGFLPTWEVALYARRQREEGGRGL